jgi:hypothetical protein
MMEPFNEDMAFINCVVGLLENSNVVNRGKSILTILLMVKVNPKTLIYLSEGKFFLTLEKLNR